MKRVRTLAAIGAAGMMLGMVPAAARAAVSAAQHAGRDAGLRVYFADVEGGQSTLFVTPEGDSMLVDSGYPGFNDRDAKRVAAMCRKAGVTKIDTMVITHYHTDHVGGVPALVGLIPVERFVDHGPNRELDGGVTERGYKAYRQVLAEKKIPHETAHVGEVLPVKGMHVQVVSADGEVLAKPLPGAGEENAACANSPEKPAENSENDRSIGMLITFGKLRIADLGDLTWAKERPLMCPVNKLGKVDVYVVSHHGLDRSGSPALIDAIAPRVAIMDNGPKKGDAPSTFDRIEDSPRIKDLWQLHTAEGNDAAHNVAASRIANLPGPTDAAHTLLLTGHRDGSFSVTNERTGETVEYPAVSR